MKRVLPWFLLVVAVWGCRLPPEREPLKPLPETGALYSFQEMLARARAQGNSAVESFYEDAWSNLEEAASGLEQTARFLPKTTDPPSHLRETLVRESAELGKEAKALAEAARAQNVIAATDTLQRITLRIRSLRPRDLPDRPKSDKEP